MPLKSFIFYILYFSVWAQEWEQILSNIGAALIWQVKEGNRCQKLFGKIATCGRFSRLNLWENLLSHFSSLRSEYLSWKIMMQHSLCVQNVQGVQPGSIKSYIYCPFHPPQTSLTASRLGLVFQCVKCMIVVKLWEGGVKCLAGEISIENTMLLRWYNFWFPASHHHHPCNHHRCHRHSLVKFLVKSSHSAVTTTGTGL